MRHTYLSILAALTIFLFIPQIIFAATPTVTTEANLKVAFLGDTADGVEFQKVLDLIKGEQVQLILHQGDFSYTTSATTWENKVKAAFPTTLYLASDGNHDDWSAYSPFFAKQIEDHKAELTVGGDVSSSTYSIIYKGLKVAFIQEKGYTPFANDSFKDDNHIWKVCSWHTNQKVLQVGSKGDERGWPLYEDCKNQGAIIATGHEHSYERTKTLTSIENQTIDPSCSDPKNLCVAPGKSFAFVSGLGGREIRNQDRCLNYPNECQYWATIYTSDQHAQYGALFIIFNYQGSPTKAHGYFKAVDGTIIDTFDITAAGTNSTTPTATPTSAAPTPTSTAPTPTSTVSACPNKSKGDADCAKDGANKTITTLDYAIWHGEFINGCSTTNLAGCGADSDHDGNVMDANFNYPGTNYSQTDTTVNTFDYTIWKQGFINQN